MGLIAAIMNRLNSKKIVPKEDSISNLVMTLQKYAIDIPFGDRYQFLLIATDLGEKYLKEGRYEDACDVLGSVHDFAKELGEGDIFYRIHSLYLKSIIEKGNNQEQIFQTDHIMDQYHGWMGRYS